MYDISVIVATYNPNMRKLYATLNSILIQENCNYEIVITDDGSKNFDIDHLKKWLKIKKFKDYKIIHNEKNEGTVKNIYRGVLESNAKFIKAISPGDLLYDKKTLHDAFKFMNDNQYKIIFGKAIYYYFDDLNVIHLTSTRNPLNIKPFLKNNVKKIKKLYFLYQDSIVGAGFVCEKNIFQEYLEKIVNKVIYAEDSAIALMIADGINIHYWDDYLIWYESNTGISTCGNSKWLEKIKNDNKECYRLIVQKDASFKKMYDLYYAEKYNPILLFFFKAKRKMRYHIFSFKNKLTIRYDDSYVEKIKNKLNVDD